MNVLTWTRRQATGLYTAVMTMVAFVFITVLIMWLLNVAGFQGINFALAFAGVFLLVGVMLAPKMIYVFFGLGALVNGLQDRDITQGGVAGISGFFRLMTGLIFYFTACATVLAIIPFKHSPSTFWGLALVIVVVSSMFTYLNISTGKWMKYIVVTAAIMLSLLLAAKLLLPDGILQLGTSGYNALDRLAERQAIIIEMCSKDPTNPICPSGASSEGTPPETKRRPVEVYDLYVPGRGCSEPAPNTDPRYWINPFPKNVGTGWPTYTEVVTPRTGKGWVLYKPSMKAYSFIRYCNYSGREMWMTVEVYKGKL